MTDEPNVDLVIGTLIQAAHGDGAERALEKGIEDDTGWIKQHVGSHQGITVGDVVQLDPAVYSDAPGALGIVSRVDIDRTAPLVRVYVPGRTRHLVCTAANVCRIGRSSWVPRFLGTPVRVRTSGR